MKTIGGYFGLELKQGDEYFHESHYRLKSGRSSLSFILQHLRPKKVYVPFYTCDALLEPLITNNVSYTFYTIDTKLEIPVLPELGENDLIIYINYFDIKRSYTERLSAIFKHRLIVDCTQSYFLKGNSVSWYFNSCRKFFGVPDGSDLYIPSIEDLNYKQSELSNNKNYIIDHLLLRFNGDIQPGYEFFKKNEILNNGKVKKISKLSTYLLSNIKFNEAIASRKSNFTYLHNVLKDSNQMQIEYNENIIPNFYPYLPPHHIDKKVFWNNKVFVPLLWADCISRNTTADFNYEKQLSKSLIPIPTDHRYNIDDMKIIIEIIFKYYERTN